MIGTVFAQVKEGKTIYWRVTNGPINILGASVYPVIRCSKTGKEYRDANMFRASYLNGLAGRPQGDPLGWIETVSTGVKANIDDGIISGKRLRRIQFLESRIKRDQTELEKLRKE